MKNIVDLVRAFCDERSGNIVIPFALTFGNKPMYLPVMHDNELYAAGFRSRYTLAVAKLNLEHPNPSFGKSRHESLNLASPQGAESY